MKRGLSLALLLVGGLAAGAELGPTNITAAYAFLGFDPSGPNCATMVHLSDVHMSLGAPEWFGMPVTTNLDVRLVEMINTLQPRPAVIAMTGDLGFVGSSAPGFGPYWPWATQEVAVAKQQLTRLTNCDAMYLIPGNHDSIPRREDGYIFTNIFPGFSRFTNFTVAGLPVLMLDTQNAGSIDAEQLAWLDGWRKRLDRTRPILLMSHVPLLGGFSIMGRESEKTALWFLDKWRAPIWIGSGHTHGRWLSDGAFQATRIAQYITPSANAAVSPSDDPRSDTAAGFAVWCITNGTVKGVISGVLTNGSYYVFDYIASASRPPYENLTNILFHVEEGRFDRKAYSIQASGDWNTKDAGFFWIYFQDYVCRLPFDRYPNATRAFFLATVTNGLHFYFGPNTNEWTEAPCELFTNGVASAVIPLDRRSDPLWLRVHTDTMNSAGGFGLGTTNAISDYAAWAGKVMGDAAVDASSQLSWGGTAWQAFIFGVNPLRMDGMKEIAGFPWVGGWPFRAGGTMRFGARSSLDYAVEQAGTAAGPWTAARVSWGPTTNGWREATVTGDGSLVWRISATPSTVNLAPR